MDTDKESNHKEIENPKVTREDLKVIMEVFPPIKKLEEIWG